LPYDELGGRFVEYDRLPPVLYEPFGRFVE
jgi:hypothetical protein